MLAGPYRIPAVEVTFDGMYTNRVPGQSLSASYMDYALPRSDDIPPLQIDHLETPSPLNPLGLKGVGESGTLPAAAVVASAVEDALSGRGLRVDRVPLTPERLRRLIGDPAVPDGVPSRETAA
jgi:CO/xanthine dehydrogenase Mo-binding subunit